MNLKRGSLAVSFLITLMGWLGTLNIDIYAQEEPLTVFPFKGVYSVGMTVTLFGDVTGSFAEGDDVSVKVNNPNGQTYQNAIAKLDDTGSYTFEYKLEGAEASVLGVHTVDATYKSFNANTSFEVKEKPALTISLDKQTYDLGDFVTISGKVTPRLLEPIEIRIFGFNNTIWTFVPV
ncbi:MAG: hypothetical protein ACE5KA_05600, partial [Nitrososphaerales archaeon]